MSFVPLQAGEPILSLTLKEALADEDGDFLPDRSNQVVSVRGIINSPANKAGDGLYYSSMQDYTGGIILYSPTAERLIGKVNIGDVVQVEGKILFSTGLRLIGVSNIVREAVGAPPTPRHVSAADLNSPLYHGQLVRVQGQLIIPAKVTSREGARLRDESGEINIVPSAAQLSDIHFTKRLLGGGEVEIVGIAGQLKNKPPYDSGFCLFPRAVEDYKYLPKPPYLWIIGSLCALLLLGGFGYLWIGRRQAERFAGTMKSVAEELEKSQLALRQGEEKYRSLFESSRDGIALFDSRGKCRAANPAFLKMVGYQAEEIDSLSLRHILAGGQGGQAGEGALLALPNSDADEMEMELTRKDGSRFLSRCSSWRVARRDGNAASLWVMARDVSAQRRAEEALRHSEASLTALIENANASIWSVDWEYRYIIFNSYFRSEASRSTGVVPRVGMSICEVAPGQSAEWIKYYDRALQGERFSAEFVHDIQGRISTFEVSFNPISTEGKITGVSVISRDITERKQLEAQLRQSQRMESVGQLAGGIAHDFNNYLTIIQGHAALILDRQEATEDVLDSVQQIALAADRGSRLTRQLLTFSRQQAMNLRQVNLNDVVRILTNLLQGVLGNQIRLRFEACPQLPAIMGDPGMLEQVLLNLAVNSRDAMPQGGDLLLQTSFLFLDLPERSAHGDYVCLSVTDSGCGIRPEDLPRIFDPFFTTKDVGKGTGLGLATTYGIIKQHKGWVDVSSKVGKGTVFRLFLPGVEEKFSPQEQPGKRASGGNETILLAEDDTEIRRMVRNILERQGYRVLEAESGQKALSLWPLYGTEVQLLMTDIMMPDNMSGYELARKIIAEKPGLPTVFISGYSPDRLPTEMEWKEAYNYLQKPFTPQKLLHTIRQAFDREKTALATAASS